MSLHDELSRIADAAPPMAVREDPWEPAQRSRRRRRLATVASVAASVALVAGLATSLPRADAPDAPVAAADALGVPDRVEAVPSRFAERGGDDAWSSDEVSDDLAIGRGAVAYVMREGLPVVLDADDGTYHLLDLPGFLGNDSFLANGLFGSRLSVALSPDGRHLAYGYAEVGPDAATEPIPSGLRVVDLTTGSLREVPVPLEEGTQVTQPAWSPDGRWLAWTGYSLGSWTGASMGRSTFVAGRVAPGAVVSEPVEPPRNDAAVAVDDAGAVERRAGLVLGRVDDRQLALRPDTGSLVLVDTAGRERRVAEVEPGVPEGLSVAVDLMSVERPTVSRPGPDWPWSQEQVAWTALGVTLLVAAAAVASLAWVSGRRRRTP
jgi:hypothetical protein